MLPSFVAFLLKISDLFAAFTLSYSLSCLSQSLLLLLLLSALSHTSTFKVAAGGSPTPSQAPCCSRLHARPTVLLCLAHLHWDRHLFIIPAFKSLQCYSPPPLPPLPLLPPSHFSYSFVPFSSTSSTDPRAVSIHTASFSVIVLIFTMPDSCFYCFL